MEPLSSPLPLYLPSLWCPPPGLSELLSLDLGIKEMTFLRAFAILSSVAKLLTLLWPQLLAGLWSDPLT